MPRDFHILSDIPSRDGTRHLIRLISTKYSDYANIPENLQLA